jgi:ElaB/YqjD/DUF883 family membrane-anchored ribosome-binding protein
MTEIEDGATDNHKKIDDALDNLNNLDDLIDDLLRKMKADKKMDAEKALKACDTNLDDLERRLNNIRGNLTMIG